MYYVIATEAYFRYKYKLLTTNAFLTRLNCICTYTFKSKHHNNRNVHSNFVNTSVLICFINSWASGETNNKVIQCSDK